MSTRVDKADDTITQIDEALHHIKARLSWLEANFPAGAALGLGDDVPLADAGSGSPGLSTEAAHADHVHPAVRWEDIEGRPSMDGATGDVTYRHVQLLPSATWEFYHGLNKYPSITAVDTSGAQVIGEPTYVDLNIIRIVFSAAVSGEAYCN